MARRERDDKFLRLTGMWESKRQGLFTGKLRPEDIEKLIGKAEEADKAGCPLVFFLWENDKGSKKDPVFTLQVAVADEDNSRGRSRGSSRGRGRDRDEDDEDEKPRRSKREDPEDEPEEEEEDEKPSRKPAGKKPAGKKKDEDW